MIKSTISIIYVIYISIRLSSSNCSNLLISSFTFIP
nr:MAG TPA_asm: hypothetical protein [Caudoviricetes sp.]